MEDRRDCEGGVGLRMRAGAPSPHDREVGEAYRDLRTSVARGLAYRTGCSDLAEDLTQDVFVDLLVAARCSPPRNTRAWLARVAQRRAADVIGSAIRERAARERLVASERGAPAAPGGDPDVRLSLRAGMARLSEQQQRIVALRLVRGLSFAHCGLTLGMTEDAARMRFARALAVLRLELEGGRDPR